MTVTRLEMVLLSPLLAVVAVGMCLFPDGVQHHHDLHGWEVEQAGDLRACGLRCPRPVPCLPCHLQLQRGDHLWQEMLLHLPTAGSSERYWRVSVQ